MKGPLYSCFLITRLPSRTRTLNWHLETIYSIIQRKFDFLWTWHYYITNTILCVYNITRNTHAYDASRRSKLIKCQCSMHNAGYKMWLGMMHLQSAVFVHSQIEQEQSANWTKSAEEAADTRVRGKVSCEYSLYRWILCCDSVWARQLHTAKTCA